MTIPHLRLIGSASGMAAADPACGEGPLVLQASPLVGKALNKIPHTFDMLTVSGDIPRPERVTVLQQHCTSLASLVHRYSQQGEFFCVLGGDHSCAIGTWSGAAQSLQDKGDLGLIWVDAHMDSHTPESSKTGNFHGMPLASLLGFGDARLTDLAFQGQKLKPHHICLIGVRSFEKGEADLLSSLNVKIFFMTEVKRRGLAAIMEEAHEYIRSRTTAFGITIDIDSMDPHDAPGTGVAEPNGIAANDLFEALPAIAEDPKLIGAEIVEFDPKRDVEHRTETIIAKFLQIFSRRCVLKS